MVNIISPKLAEYDMVLLECAIVSPYFPSATGLLRPCSGIRNPNSPMTRPTTWRCRIVLALCKLDLRVEPCPMGVEATMLTCNFLVSFSAIDPLKAKPSNLKP